MKKIPCGNPEVIELKKGDGKRYINAEKFKKVIKNGIKHCAWCGEKPVSGNRKYCNNICRDNCYAFIHPQKELGLEYHLQSQNFKCAGCNFDYMPIMEEMLTQYEKRYIKDLRFDTEGHPYFFKRLKYRTTIKYGFGKNPEVDHIVPIALGGDSVGFDNHQVLCYDCHKNKTKIDLSDIAKTKRRQIMWDLSGSIEGQSVESIASYFKYSVDEVQRAVDEGAKTYQDVYDFVRTDFSGPEWCVGIGNLLD